jgi:hypothetical protein
VACQQVFPVQTTAAEAVIAEKANTPAPIAAPISVLLNDAICYSVFLIVAKDNWNVPFLFLFRSKTITPLRSPKVGGRNATIGETTRLESRRHGGFAEAICAPAPIQVHCDLKLVAT